VEIYIRPTSKINPVLLKNMLKKISSTELKFNSKLIKSDIKKTETLYTSLKKYKTHEKNLHFILEYLKKILAKSRKGNLKITWGYENKIISKPVEIKKIELYKIYTLDYLEKGNETILIDINFSGIIDLLTFEIIHTLFPLKTPKGVIEKKLYQKVLNLQIPADKTIKNYFGRKFRGKSAYSKAVLDTCNTTANLITQGILLLAKEELEKIKIAGVFEDSISLLIQKDNTKFIKKLEETYIIVKLHEKEPKIKLDITKY